MSSFTFIMDFTPSKLLAYIIVVIGSVYSFIFKDSSVLISTFAASSAVIAMKTYTESRSRDKELEFRNKSVDNPEENNG